MNKEEKKQLLAWAMKKIEQAMFIPHNGEDRITQEDLVLLNKTKELFAKLISS